MSQRVRTVIVGAGIAGVSAAAGMRSAGFDGEVILVGDEPELPYRRPPVSKEIIRGEKSADQIRIKKADWYGDNEVELMTGTHVTSIDTAERRLDLDSGTPLSYDQLLLATGGRARTIAGATGVRTLRTLADVPRLQSELTPGQRVIVVGAGLIGSEIAASARGLGCEVTLLEAAGLPLPRLLPPEIGQRYVDLHKGEGTELHTEVTVTSIIGSIVEAGAETVVTAADGRTWSAPVVLLAIGMEPNTELAEAAGIDVADGITADGITVDGITVDEWGQTSIPGIYAAGDVANQPNAILGRRHRVEHWQGAQHHGTAVGKAMAGDTTPIGEVPWCWSDQYGHNLQVAGWPGESDDWVLRGDLDGLDFTALFLRGGRLIAAITIGRAADVRAARKIIAGQQAVDRDVLADETAAVADSVTGR